MRYAIISDIHANRQALNVVLVDIKSIGVDSIICLGDIVGYGPSPVETVEHCYQDVNHFVLGNHDAAVTGELSTDNFNDNAKFLIDWTSSRLEDGHKKFFSSMPLMLKGKNFRCSHGSFNQPGRFLYIFEEAEALKEFSAFNEQSGFVGHSHIPGIFVIGASKTPHWLNPTNFNIEDDKRYIVNVGSVGQPRDDDMRASYCIYDEEKGDILFRRIPFDIEAYRRDQMRTGLPEKSSYFVELYLSNVSKPLRDTIDFKALSAENAVCGALELKNLEGELKKLKKTKIILMFIALIFVILSIIAIFFYFNACADKRRIAEKAQKTEDELAKKTKTIYKMNALSPSEFPKTDRLELISMPPLGIASAESPFENWIVELSFPKEQSVECENFEDKKQGKIAVFRINSKITDEIFLKFRPLQVKKGMRFSASAQFKKNSLSAGHIALQLVLEKKDVTTLILEQNIPNEIKENDNWTKRTSITLSKDEALREDGLLYFVIKGNFQGEILVRNCSLMEKK